jgi:hypothetical protein
MCARHAETETSRPRVQAIDRIRWEEDVPVLASFKVISRLVVLLALVLLALVLLALALLTLALLALALLVWVLLRGPAHQTKAYGEDD